jgi:hypothetical protein
VSGNKTEEIGLAKLSIGSVSLAEQIEAQQKQKEILRTMAGVVSDHRTGNVHAQSTSMLPERPTTAAPAPKGTGWQDQVPLSPPPGVRECDRLVDAFEEEERRPKK